MHVCLFRTKMSLPEMNLSKHKGSTEKLGYNWNGPQFHFGLWLFWSLKNLVLKSWFLHENAISWFHAGPKLLRDQISWGPKKSGAQMRPWTISVTAILNANYFWFCNLLKSKNQKVLCTLFQKLIVFGFRIVKIKFS